MRLTITVTSLTLLLMLAQALLTVGSASAPAQGAPGSWDMGSAAKYLDAQMDAWIANGKKLQTGRETTVCISCHTTLTYALARPALRRAQGIGNPVPQESRLLREIGMRVETFGENQAFYDANERQLTESESTEAVLNALILARDDNPRHEARAVTQKAFNELWATQGADGAWDWLQFSLEPWETTDSVYNGATLAALAVGTAPRYSAGKEATAGTDKLRAYLKQHYPQQNIFNRVSALLASSRFKDVITAQERNALVADLRNRQRPDGGWSLWSMGKWTWSRLSAPFVSPGTLDTARLEQSDGLATGLVVYALRETGSPAGDPLVKRGLEWLRTNVQSVQIDGRPHTAWRAHSLNYDRERGGPRGVPWRQMFMSNAATAFAVLALVGPECATASAQRC